MTSPQESRSILVDPATLPCRLFLCNEERESLAGTAALDYIRHGEAQGLSRLPTCAARKPWYSLIPALTAPIATIRLIDTTAYAFLHQPSIRTNNVLYQIYGMHAAANRICGAMNSTFFQMLINVYGRVNFGGGVLEIASYEYSNMLITDPTVLPDFDESIFRSTRWDVLDPSPERRMVDDAVFDALGLTQGERDSVYEAVRDLVTKRLAKAKSLR